MVAMEKITYKPLIVALHSNRELYNLWYTENQLKYGEIPVDSFTNWMIEVVQPLVQTTVPINDATEKIDEVLKTLYLESLKLTGSHLSIRYKDSYKSAWLLLLHFPKLVVKFPKKIIHLINDVVSNFNNHESQNIPLWCQLMENVAEEIESIEDFKNAGRIFAWKCGLAHLRNTIVSHFYQVNEGLQKSITASFEGSSTIDNLVENPWCEKQLQFYGTLGGFIGTTGFFEKPPQVAQINDYVFVTDTVSNYAVFADQFGKILLPALSIDIPSVVTNSKKNTSINSWLANQEKQIDVANINSIVKTKDTIFFTLNNSHYLYLCSYGNE